jgi:hypothetical protein
MTATVTVYVIRVVEYVIVIPIGLNKIVHFVRTEFHSFLESLYYTIYHILFSHSLAKTENFHLARYS